MSHTESGRLFRGSDLETCRSSTLSRKRDCKRDSQRENSVYVARQGKLDIPWTTICQLPIGRATLNTRTITIRSPTSLDGSKVCPYIKFTLLHDVQTHQSSNQAVCRCLASHYPAATLFCVV